MTMVKPGRWAVTPGAVHPNWQWAWEGEPAIMLPLWEGTGPPVQYAQGPDISVDNEGTWEAQEGGLSYRIDANNEDLNWAEDARYGLVGDIAASWFIALHPTGQNGTVITFFAYGNTGLRDGQYGLQRQAFGGRDLAFVWRESSTQRQARWTFSWPANENDGLFHSLGVVRYIGGELELWLDGVSLGLGTDNTFETPVVGAQQLNVGNARPGAGNTQEGDYLVFMYVRGRAWGDAEFRALHADPFGPFRMADSIPIPAGVALSVLLFATADGTIVDVVNEDDLASPLSPSIDDDPATPDDTDWNNNAIIPELFYDLPGSVGHYASTLDHIDFDVTDVDLRIDLSLDDVTPPSNGVLLSKWAAVGTRSYSWAINTSGEISFAWSTTGSNLIGPFTRDITGVATAGERIQFKVTLDVDNGASGYDLAFWWRSGGNLEDDAGWIQIGATFVGGATTSIHAGSADPNVGAHTNGANSQLAGDVYQGLWLGGIDGSIVADFAAADFALNDSDTDTAVDQTGKTWTLNGTASAIATNVSVFYDVTDLPTDFGNAETAEITVRYAGVNFINDSVTLHTQLFEEDETTALSDEVLVVTITGDSAFDNTTAITLTGLSVNTGKSKWNNARLRLRWS